MGIGNISNTMYKSTPKSELEIDRISDYNDYEEDTLNKSVKQRYIDAKITKNSKILKMEVEEDLSKLTKNPLIKSLIAKGEEHIDGNVLNKLKNMSEKISLGFNNDQKNKKTVKFLNISKKRVIECIENNLENEKDLNENLDDEIKKSHEEKIIIGNKTYLKSEFDLISKAVLKRCNYSKEKNNIHKNKNENLTFTNEIAFSKYLDKLNTN